MWQQLMLRDVLRHAEHDAQGRVSHIDRGRHLTSHAGQANEIVIGSRYLGEASKEIW